MNHHITYRHAIEMLESQGMKYQVLELADGWRAIVTQYGGRLLGPFRNETAQSVLWINMAMKDAQSFARFVKDRVWNLGGERFWLNPELRFYCKAPELFDATYTVQGELDPGNYEIEARDGGVFLKQRVSLTDLNNGARKDLSIERRYAPAQNPLKFVKSLQDVRAEYCGVVQDISLRDELPGTRMYLEPWVLTQVNPGGKFVTPLFGEFDFVDYYDPVEDMQRFRNGYAELDVTGNRKYKVAYRSAQTFGRMAYVAPMDGGWHLMVRNYYNDPSIPYCSEPWGDLGNRGCSTYYYNDGDPCEGGFGEFENGGQTIGLDSGRSSCWNTTSLWFFFGSQQDIGRIMRVLLGIDYQF